jgi:hypothetical protein
MEVINLLILINQKQDNFLSICYDNFEAKNNVLSLFKSIINYIILFIFQNKTFLKNHT